MTVLGGHTRGLRTHRTLRVLSNLPRVLLLFAARTVSSPLRSESAKRCARDTGTPGVGATDPRACVFRAPGSDGGGLWAAGGPRGGARPGIQAAAPLPLHRPAGPVFSSPPFTRSLRCPGPAWSTPSCHLGDPALWRRRTVPGVVCGHHVVSHGVLATSMTSIATTGSVD